MIENEQNSCCCCCYFPKRTRMWVFSYSWEPFSKWLPSVAHAYTTGITWFFALSWRKKKRKMCMCVGLKMYVCWSVYDTRDNKYRQGVCVCVRVSGSCVWMAFSSVLSLIRICDFTLTRLHWYVIIMIVSVCVCVQSRV